MYLKYKNELHRVKLSEILVLRQEGRNVRITTEDLEYVVKGIKIADLKEILNEDFCQCHSYLIVNTSYIRIIRNNEIVLENGAVVGMCHNAIGRLKKFLKISANFNENV